MTIKHLVISGGGPIMIQTLGAIQHLEKNGFLNFGEIQSIYGTSAGGIVGTLICLKYDWETINDYIIKRPWHDVFHVKVQSIFDAYTKKGIFDNEVIKKCFKPLLAAKDLALDINLEDFYNFSGIEIHFFAFEVNEYKVYDISYLTHPKMELLTAIQMTCGLPVLMTPVIIEDKCYIDGGMASNYPLDLCINSGKEPDEILGFKNKYAEKENIINADSTLLDFVLTFLFKAVLSFNTENKQPCIKHEVICDAQHLSVEVLKNALSSTDVRRSLFDNGVKSAELFLENLNSNKSV
jgi:predicted acylesterase/phospholipase RssA